MASAITSNQIAEPGERDLLDKAFRNFSRSLNCVKIGKIEAFFPATNTASVSISFKAQKDDGTEIEYPLLVDTPVVVLAGGTSFLGLPITPGDSCLVFFCDRDIDNWWVTGSAAVPSSFRAHSLSDAVALVGIRPMVNPVAVSAGKTELNGGAGLIAIKNAAFSLKTLVDNLIDNINSITTTNAVVGAPCALSPTSTAALTALKAQFDLLLGD
jgi:hypothetical protein